MSDPAIILTWALVVWLGAAMAMAWIFGFTSGSQR